jgi:hypothetical protein
MVFFCGIYETINFAARRVMGSGRECHVRFLTFDHFLFFFAKLAYMLGEILQIDNRLRI